MGLGVNSRVLLASALVVLVGCSADDDPKPVKLNPQPEIPVVPDASRNTGVGRKEGEGGTANSRDTLRRKPTAEVTGDPRPVGDTLPVSGNEGGAGNE